MISHRLRQDRMLEPLESKHRQLEDQLSTDWAADQATRHRRTLLLLSIVTIAATQLDLVPREIPQFRIPFETEQQAARL